MESFLSRIRDEPLDGESFLYVEEMRYVVERGQMDYNHCWPHSSLNDMPLADFAGRRRRAGCRRLHTPVLDKVDDGGILS